MSTIFEKCYISKEFFEYLFDKASNYSDALSGNTKHACAIEWEQAPADIPSHYEILESDFEKSPYAIPKHVSKRVAFLKVV